MKKEEKLLLEDVASLAINIWYKLVNTPTGHPGPPGPPGSSSNKNDGWSNEKATLMQIKVTLKEVTGRL